MDEKDLKNKQPLAKRIDVKQIVEKYAKMGLKVEVCKPRLNLIKDAQLT